MPRLVRGLLSVLLAASPFLAASGPAAPPQAGQSSKPLAYLRKSIGDEPYGLWKTQPLNRRLKALLGPEYQGFIANLDPATPVAEQGGILHVEGNAPHRGGEEEAVLLIDVDNDTIEVFLRHKESQVLGFAENKRSVVIPHDAMDTMSRWPRQPLAQALAGIVAASRNSNSAKK
jgi:hypothetical protein